MKRIPSRIATIAVVLGLSAGAYAQRNAETEMLMPPFRTEVDMTQVNNAVKCIFPVPTTSAIFGVTEINGTSNPVEFLVSGQTTPYTIFRIDENCNLISSWTTASAATSNTGIAYDQNSNTYWFMQNTPNPRGVVEFNVGTGTPTGRSFPVGNNGVKGPLTEDANTAFGNDFYYEDIALDAIFQFDPIGATFGCTFANPDNTGSGAFGNGLDDAVNNSCGGNLVVTSGTINEGQVRRAGQFDCAGACPNKWNFLNTVIPLGETFIQDVAEFTATGGEVRMAVGGGTTNNVFIIANSLGIQDCQGVDNEQIFTVNFSNGGTARTKTIGVNGPMTLRSVKPTGGGNGKYTVNYNAGWPTTKTIVNLPSSLGKICFQIVGSIPASQKINLNNIGRTSQLGGSKYFGVPIANPPVAPSTVLARPAGDPTNMPAGSIWTVQGVILNPAASSPKNASVTNALQLIVQ